jgi:hypothetical protein
MRRLNIISWATEERAPITGWTPVERTDTIVYNWADYEAVPHYTIGAIPTNEGYITRGQYQISHSDDWLTAQWIEKCPKTETIAYFIN